MDRLTHRRQNLPESQRLTELGEQRSEVASRLAVQRTEVDDMAAEIRKAEADVAQVRTRRERDQQRLDTGAVTSAKDLEGLQHEITSLDRRIGDLEDAELAVMERLESAQAEQQRAEAELAALDDELAATAATRDAALRDIETEAAQLQAERDKAAGTLPGDLLALYDKVRGQHGGVGAAAMRQRRCEGCRLELNAADVREIATTPHDEVLRCPECQRLLVRTAESGL